MNKDRSQLTEKYGKNIKIAAPRPQVIVTDYKINEFKMWVIARIREMIGNKRDQFDTALFTDKEYCDIGLNIHADAVGKLYKHTIINGRLFTLEDKAYMEHQTSPTMPIYLFLGDDKAAGPKLKEMFTNEIIEFYEDLDTDKIKIHWNDKIRFNMEMQPGRVLIGTDNGGRAGVTGMKGQGDERGGYNEQTKELVIYVWVQSSRFLFLGDQMLTHYALEKQSDLPGFFFLFFVFLFFCFFVFWDCVCHRIKGVHTSFH